MASLDNVLDAAELDLLMDWVLVLEAFSPDCLESGRFVVVLVFGVGTETRNWGALGVDVGICVGAFRCAGAGLAV